MASPAPGTLSDAAHDEEVALQKEIAEQVDVEAPENQAPEAPETPEVVEEAPAPEVAPVPIQPVGGATFPLRITAVGVEDELVFESAEDVVEVKPEVAEQLTYSPAVAVVEEEDE